VRRILAAVDVLFALAVWGGATAIALSVCWQLALIIGGLLGLLATAIAESRRSR
jgi:hypothetical protein